MEPDEMDSNVSEYMALFVKALEGAVQTIKSLRVPADSTPTAQRDQTSCPEARARVAAAASNLKEILLDGPLASRNPARISRTLRQRLFVSLTGGLDVIRELYAEVPQWTSIKSDRFMSTWSNLEVQVALEDAQEHLECIERRPIRQIGFPYTSIDSPTGIRLVRLLPHHDPEAPIECQLLHVDRYQDRTYAVLSYASNSFQIPILLDNHAFHIPSNLHSALQHFRHETRPRLLWIDALCVNHSDPVDKNNQVSRTRAIYQNAYTILMWTGPESQNSETAMTIFLSLEEIFAPEPPPEEPDPDSDGYSDSYSYTNSYTNSHTNSYSNTQVTFTSDASHKNEVYPYLMHPLISTSLLPAVLADPNGTATRAFFNRRYWHRVWTLTETVIGKRSLLCCGEYGATWETVAKATKESKGLAIAVGLEQTNTANSGSVMDTLWIARVFDPVSPHAELSAKLHDPDEEISLVDALIVAQKYAASDTRDYIYGVLPLIDNSELQIDYNKPAFRVYMDVVREEVHRSESWDVLSACRAWDFTRQRERFVPLEEFVQSCLDDDGDVPELAAVADVLRPDSEDDDTDSVRSYRDDLGEMGRVIAFSLARGGATHEERKQPDETDSDPGTFEDMAMAWLPSWVPRWDLRSARQADIRKVFNREGQQLFHAAPGTTPRYAFKGFGGSQLQASGTKVDVVHSVTAARDFTSMWEHWVRSRASLDAPAPSTFLEPRPQGGGGLRSVSFGLPLKKPAENKSLGLRAISLGTGGPSMGPKRLQRAVSQPLLRGRSVNAPDEKESGARRAIASIAESISDRQQQGLDLAFFVTVRGFVGVGPMAMEDGDVVCVLFGGRAPLVLRPHQRGFHLVGEAYVEGLMRGEVLGMLNRGQLVHEEFTLT